MNVANVIEKKSPKEIDALKDRLFKSKSKRMEMIDGFIDKLRGELETRDLSKIPTTLISKMLIDFAALAKKEQPVIELRYSQNEFDYNSEKVIF